MTADEPQIYASGPTAASDSDFEPGEIAHLVAGNAGRLLDARRTPVSVTRVDEPNGMFEVRVEGFEDAGALWEVPFEWAGRFQFQVGAPRLPARAVERYAAIAERLGVPLRIAPDPATRATTLARIAEQRAEVAAALDHRGFGEVDLGRAIAARAGEPALFALVHELLETHRLSEMDREFATRYASNPWAGEVVKGHAIVAAELGLAPFDGHRVRDPACLDGDWSRERRAEHVVLRAAITQELWSRSGSRDVVVYRAAASERPLRAREPATFASATLSREVAEAHFAGTESTAEAVIARRRVAVSGLLMTFLETEALNHPYREAEAVLIGWTPLSF